jgi:stage V sporulation protein G
LPGVADERQWVKLLWTLPECPSCDGDRRKIEIAVHWPRFRRQLRISANCGGKEYDVEITEVRIKLMEDAGERLQAFCSITLDDCFVIRDLKIIEGTNGPFVAMPSRKLTAHCPKCGCKNHLRANFCNQCGLRLQEDRTVKDEDGRAKLYADIAHPINSACREMIQDHVIHEFYEEQERAKLPGYVSKYDDVDFDEPPRQPHFRPVPARPARGGDRPRTNSIPRPRSDGHPRGPHKSAGHTPNLTEAPINAPKPLTDGESNSGGFGAGIF